MLLKLGSSFSDCDRNLRVRWRTLNIIQLQDRWHRINVLERCQRNSRQHTKQEGKWIIVRPPWHIHRALAARTWTKESVANKLGYRAKTEILVFFSSQNKETCVVAICKTTIRTQNQNSPFFFCVCKTTATRDRSERRLPARAPSVLLRNNRLWLSYGIQLAALLGSAHQSCISWSIPKETHTKKTRLKLTLWP